MTRAAPTASRTAAGSGAASPTGAIVFSDIVGFTELTEAHGDDAALELVDRHGELARQVMRPGSRVVKELGDGLLLWFDRPDDALCAALDLQDRIAASPPPSGLPMWVRTGVHWGSPRRRGDDIIGHDVNLTSRVTALAAPGEVLCTESVVQAIHAAGTAPSGIELDALGEMFVKGVADPVPVYRVTRSRS
ncbi:MAG: adenylate/guanylate cyclase domain-containing protein [Acidimicrobiales bacterium]